MLDGACPTCLGLIDGSRADDDRHYEDCWNELAKMFASTQTLPPRTKRWAEAKVLADCIAVRVSFNIAVMRLTIDMSVIALYW